MKRLLLALSLIAGNLVLAQPAWVECASPDFQSRVDDIFMVNTEVGYAVCGDGKIVKSTDGGDNWDLLLEDASVYCRSVEFVNDQKGFVGAFPNSANNSTNILRRTDDGGATWTDLTSLLHPHARNGICGLAVTDALTVYGCGNWFQDSAYLIKSTDGGASWDFIDMSAYATSLIDMHWLNSNVGFVTGKSPAPLETGIILYTTDGGQTWETKFENDTPDEYCWKIQKLTDQIYFASLEDLTDVPASILKSIDGGMNWTRIPVTTSYYNLEGVGFINGFDGWAGGDINYSLASHDGGASWEVMNTPLPYLNRLFRVNDSIIFGSGSRIWKYTDATAGLDHTLTSPQAFSIVGTYPNPVSDILHIELDIKYPTRAMLQLYTSDGRHVAEITNSYISAGNHEFTFDVSKLPPGNYHLSLRTHADKQQVKVIIDR